MKEIDHINRDGLDNRLCNIREGSNRINSNNKRIQKNNTSGVKGVYITGNNWVAQWNDINGKRHKKSFSIGKNGNEEASRLACEYREKEYAKTLAHIGLVDNNIK